jgi:hypothetical protein
VDKIVAGGGWDVTRRRIRRKAWLFSRAAAGWSVLSIACLSYLVTQGSLSAMIGLGCCAALIVEVALVIAWLYLRRHEPLTAVNVLTSRSDRTDAKNLY